MANSNSLIILTLCVVLTFTIHTNNHKSSGLLQLPTHITNHFVLTGGY